MRLFRPVQILFPVLVLAASFAVATPGPATAATRSSAGIDYRSSSSGSALDASSLALARPAGVEVGDLLLARVANREQSAATLTAAGWTAAGTTRSGARTKSWIFWRTATAAEPSSYTFTTNVATTLAGTISAFSGVDALRPVEGFAGRVNGSTATFTTPGLTTLTGNDVAVWFGTQAFDGPSCADDPVTPPSGFTEATEHCQNSTPGLTTDVAYSQLGTPAVRAIGAGRSSSATTNITQVLALRAAATPVKLHATSTATAVRATKLAVPRPSGTDAGDVLVARIAGRNHVSSAMAPPTGWTLVRSDQSSYAVRSWIFVHVATTNEPSSYSFGASTAQNLAGTISAVTGVDTADPVDVSSGATNGNSAAFAAPAPTTTADGDLALWFGTQAANLGSCLESAVSPPSGYAESAESCLASLTAGLSFDVASDTLGLAGAQKLAAGSSASGSTNLTQVVALRPATAAAVADRFAAASVNVGSVTDSDLYEPSGIAASRVNPRVQYVHSEKDRPTMLALSTTDASVVGKYTVSIPNVWDWEDIATGPCPTGSCIFAGDIGLSNGETPAADKSYSIYRVPEPNIAAGQTSGALTGDQFRFRYPGGALYEAEALMVHPVTGDIYVITKVENGQSGVYKFPNPLPAPSTSAVTTLTKVATLNIPTYPGNAQTDPHAATWYAQVSAAAIHPSAERFLVRTPYMVYEYRAPAGGSFESAFTGTRVTLTAPSSEGQGEAIDYAADGSGYYTLGEEKAPPYVLKRVDRI